MHKVNLSVCSIFYFLIALTCFSCTSIKKYNYQITEKKHDSQALKEDLDFVHRILTENHPGAYWYIGKNELDRKLDSVKNTINAPLTTAQFYTKVAPFVAAIRCGHTSVRVPQAIHNTKEREQMKKLIFPLDQFTYHISGDGKLYIFKSKDTTTLVKGAEILEIDGLPVADIVEQLNQTISNDGYNQTHYAATLSRFFAQRYHLYYGKKDSVLITYQLPKGGMIKTSIGMLTLKSDVKSTTSNSKVTKSKYEKYKGKSENGEAQLDFRFLDEKKQFAYLKIRSFSTPAANYEKFYKQSFNQIKLASSENLIIDLRDNGGGSLDASRNLFSYLTDRPFVYLDQPITNGYFDVRKYGSVYQKISYFLFGHNDKDDVNQDKEGRFYSHMKGAQPLSPHKNNFKGKLYVLINGYTFSAASLLSANIKGINRATFIGEETGGGYNQCVAGRLPIIELKNSKLQLRFGLYAMGPSVKTTTYGRGVFPDVAISSSWMDKVNGVDQELNWIINHTKMSK